MARVVDQTRHVELFYDALVVIDLEYLPKCFIVSREASLIAQELVISRRDVNESTKKTGIDFVVSVALKCSLSTGNHCDVTILATATSCHFNFAKVLQAIQSGDKQLLYTRNTKCNTIKATHWPEEISKFVLNESNSRSVPGKEQVSVKYGFHLPKYIPLAPGRTLHYHLKKFIMIAHLVYQPS